MKATESVDPSSLVEITTADFSIFSYLLRITPLTVYHRAYKVNDGTFFMDLDKGLPTFNTDDVFDMVMCRLGVVMGIVPLYIPEPPEERTSGEVRYFYQVLTDEGELTLLQSFAIESERIGRYGDDFIMPSWAVGTIPGFSEWAKGKQCLSGC